MPDHDLMQTFPPIGDGAVTLENWRTPPHNRWAYQHVSELVPSAQIWRGSGPVWELPRASLDLSDISYTDHAGAPETVAGFLDKHQTDGICVLRYGEIVMEHYRNGLQAHRPHILMSVSKSITALVIGILVEQGKLDPAAGITHLIPEVEGSAFGDCTLQHLLDMTAGVDFKLAYSPERIDPGNREWGLRNTPKVVGGFTEGCLERAVGFYEQLVDTVVPTVGLREAEFAKLLENTYRHVNIALMNELAIIFNRLGIDTLDVLETAGTKWNFLPFRPGLVGGHCIGVDPYYLTYKAETVGYHPQVILAGRRINDDSGRQLAARMIKLLVRTGGLARGVRVAVLGVAFKENCPDTRNSRVFECIEELSDYGLEPLVVDPVADTTRVRTDYGVHLVGLSALSDVSGVILAVAHAAFCALTPQDMLSWSDGAPVPVLDPKGVLDRQTFGSVGYPLHRA